MERCRSRPTIHLPKERESREEERIGEERRGSERRVDEMMERRGKKSKCMCCDGV